MMDFKINELYYKLTDSETYMLVFKQLSDVKKEVGVYLISMLNNSNNVHHIASTVKIVSIKDDIVKITDEECEKLYLSDFKVYKPFQIRFRKENYLEGYYNIWKNYCKIEIRESNFNLYEFSHDGGETWVYLDESPWENNEIKEKFFGNSSRITALIKNKNPFKIYTGYFVDHSGNKLFKIEGYDWNYHYRDFSSNPDYKLIYKKFPMLAIGNLKPHIFGKKISSKTDINVIWQEYFSPVFIEYKNESVRRMVNEILVRNNKNEIDKLFNLLSEWS